MFQGFPIFMVYILLMIGVGFFCARKIKNENQYLLANRNIGFFSLTATLVMTELNTSTLIAFSSLGYAVGWWAVSMAAVFLIGLLFYAATVANKWKGFNGISVAQFFSKRYGKDVGILISIILFIAMALFSATYVKSLTMIFTPLLPNLNMWFLSGALTILVLAMTLRGGLVSIIWTDVLSFIAAGGFLACLIWYTLNLPTLISESPTLDEMTTKLPPKFILSLILMTMFSYIIAPWYGQKVIAARTKKIATLSVAFSAILVFLFYGICILLTAIYKSKNPDLAHAELAFPTLINHALPTSLKGLGLGILFSIAATTLSGVWSAMITIIVGENHSNQQTQQASQNTLKRSVLLTLLCAFLSYFGANTLIDHILNKMILINIPIVALSFSLLGGFYWKGATRAGVYASAFIGILWGAYCYLHYGEGGMYTWYFSFYGIPLIFLTGITISLLTHQEKQLITRHQI